MLNRRRMQVDPSHDQHVVVATAQPDEPRRRPTASARLDDDSPDVTRAVPDQRQRLLGQRREHELAFRPRLQRGAARRIHDLDEKVVLLDVQPLARGTFRRNAGPAHLRQPIEVERGQPECLLDLSPHRLRHEWQAASE